MRIASVCLLTFFIGALAAQDTKTDSKTEGPKAEVKVDTNAQGVFLVICDSAPNKFVVLDSNGKWMSSVKSIDMAMETNGPVANISCTMYEGLIKPTKPSVKLWKLKQIKTVTTDEFQQLIDDLQTNPDAIKNLKK